MFAFRPAIAARQHFTARVRSGRVQGRYAPAASMPSRFWMVPKLTSKAPVARLRSAISSGAVAIMGDAPSASVAFADCVVTTLFVICAWGWCQPPRNGEHADRVT